MDVALRSTRAPLAHLDVIAGTRREPACPVVSGRAETCHTGAGGLRHPLGHFLQSLSRCSLYAQTTESYLVLVSLEYNADESPYQSPPLAPNAARHFLPGAGEALPLQSLSLRLEGVIRIEGTLLRYVVMWRYVASTGSSLYAVSPLAKTPSCSPLEAHRHYSVYRGQMSVEKTGMREEVMTPGSSTRRSSLG